jgi:hypothetical protein
MEKSGCLPILVADLRCRIFPWSAWWFGQAADQNPAFPNGNYSRYTLPLFKDNFAAEQRL